MIDELLVCVVRTCHARDFDGLRDGRYHSVVRDSSGRNEYLLENGADTVWMHRAGPGTPYRDAHRSSSVPDFAMRTANNDPTQHCACLRVHNSHPERLTSV